MIMGNNRQRTAANGAAETFATRVASGRARHFVGRAPELKHWRHFIGPDNRQPLWFISGIGGIGKTMLLRMFQADALARGLAPVYLDASQIAVNPQPVHSALRRATRQASAPLLLIDSFEYWQSLEHWFRQVFLPAQSATLQVVFAGRHGPSQEWLTDAGWRPLVATSVLAPLDESECRTYLWRRHVADGRQKRLIAFAGGHPLALATATDAARAGRPVPDAIGDADDDLVRPLVDRFTREAATADQRRALDAAVVVHEINASLLAAMLAVDDASELFAWLEQLPITEAGRGGLSLSALARGGLMRDMVNRCPQHYQGLARNAITWFVERLETSRALTWDAAARLAEQAAYTLRGADMARQLPVPAIAPAERGRLCLDRWRAGDEAIVDPMIARQQGEESLRWFRYWRQQAPDHIIVVRAVDCLPAGMFLRLDMETLTAAACEADPLTRTLRHTLDTQFTLRPGDHLPFFRHCIADDRDGNHVTAISRLLAAIQSYNLSVPNLRLTAQIADHNTHWKAAAPSLGIQRLDDECDDHRQHIYYNDWAVEPPASYYRGFADRVFGHAVGVNGKAPTASGGGANCRLDKAAFARATTQALKDFQRPRKLRKNELLHCALIAAELGAESNDNACIERLRRCFETIIDVLADNDAAGQRHARLLRAAYMNPAASLKAVAAAQYMGYSTFRRHLADAREALTAELWQREKARR